MHSSNVSEPNNNPHEFVPAGIASAVGMSQAEVAAGSRSSLLRSQALQLQAFNRGSTLLLALYDFDGRTEDELSCKQNDLLMLIEKYVIHLSRAIISILVYETKLNIHNFILIAFSP